MRKTLLTLVASTALLGVVGAAHAGTDVGQWTAGLGGTWTSTDHDRGLKNGAGAYLSGGYAMNENWDVGLNFFVGNYDVVGVVNKRTVKGITFDFDRVFKRDERISPFLEFGTGIVDQYRPGFGVARKEVVAKFGGGVLADVYTFGNGNKLQAKFDAVARTSIGRQITDIVATLGGQVTMGGGK